MMNKLVEVLGISESSNWGAVAGCHAPEWDDMDETEILSWFEKFKILSFDNGVTIEFYHITPCKSACFGKGKGQAILRLTELPNINILTPAKAHLM